MAQQPQDGLQTQGSNGGAPATGAANAEMLQLLVDNVKEYAIIILDPPGNITSWSPTAERLKGYRADESLGI